MTLAPQSAIPLQAVASQTLNVTLNGQAVTLNLYSRGGALYMDVVCSSMYLGGLYGVLCLNARFIVIDAYWGFTGDFAFQDTQGADDPVYTGLGSRYLLVYYA